MRSPDFRALALASGEIPKGPMEEGLSALLANKPTPSEVSYAHAIYEDPYKSEVLEAFILAEVPAEKIFDVLKVPTKVTEVYKYLFFDRSVFNDELDVEAYAQSYPDDTKEQKYGKELKICAITLGADYLVYRFSRKEASIDLADALKSMIVNAYMLTKASKLNPLDTNTSRESRQWAAMAVKAMETFTRVKPFTENTDDEFRIALETIDRTTNATKSDIKSEDIVH